MNYPPLSRYPELVSGSIAQNEPKLREDEWILKQVQDDSLVLGACLQCGL